VFESGLTVDINVFKDSPVGELRPITGYEGERPYSTFAFVPKPLPSSIQLTERTHSRVAQANLDIGRLDFAVRRLPDPALLVRPALRREAQSTSELEGTYAPLEEILEADFLEESQRTAEVKEVMNFVRAAERGLDLIKKLPVCLSMISELQRITVRGTRGDTYDAGQLRTRQVFIGDRSRRIEDSRFIPPPPGDLLVQGMSDWEKWINDIDDDVSPLVKAAVGHYQFETLHPFSDGNGRIGRLIITLQLVEAQALRYPILNLSPWLNDRREEYKDHLLNVSITGDFNPWVQFFCQAVIEEAARTVRKIEDLLTAREEMRNELRAQKVRGVAVDIVDSLIGYPYITVPEAAELHGVTYPPANAAIARLVEMGILSETTGNAYGRIFVCPRIRKIITSR